MPGYTCYKCYTWTTPAGRANALACARVVTGRKSRKSADAGMSKRQQITAHVAGSSSLLRVLPGEAVVVEIMAYDPGRGRIVRRRT